MLSSEHAPVIFAAHSEVLCADSISNQMSTVSKQTRSLKLPEGTWQLHCSVEQGQNHLKAGTASDVSQENKAAEEQFLKHRMEKSRCAQRINKKRPYLSEPCWGESGKENLPGFRGQFNSWS